MNVKLICLLYQFSFLNTYWLSATFCGPSTSTNFEWPESERSRETDDEEDDDDDDDDDDDVVDIDDNTSLRQQLDSSGHVVNTHRSAASTTTAVERGSTSLSDGSTSAEPVERHETLPRLEFSESSAKPVPSAKSTRRRKRVRKRTVCFVCFLFC